MRRSVLVVQPYVPEYRVPLWQQVAEKLGESGVGLQVMAGRPLGDLRARGDESSMDGLRVGRSRSIQVGSGPAVRWQSSWRALHSVDAIVTEASGSLIDSYVAVASRKPTALFGHIGSFTGPERRLDSWLEGWQLRKANHVIAYTEQGAEVARSRGVSNDRLTVVNNTVETAELQAAVANMSASVAQDLLAVGPRPRCRTFAYIGALDESKRLDLLADALDLLWRRGHDVLVIVGGVGSCMSMLSAAEERGQVKFVGRAGVSEKAAMAKLASAIVMPGRVGLVAVDSFVLGLPIMTTAHSYHAPEFHYLRDGVDARVLDESAPAFATALQRVESNWEEFERLREAARQKSGWPSMDNMSTSFADACLRLLVPQVP